MKNGHQPQTNPGRGGRNCRCRMDRAAILMVVVLVFLFLVSGCRRTANSETGVQPADRASTQTSSSAGTRLPAGEQAGERQQQVVATTYPLYEFARRVAGERAIVTLLVPPGAEPHDWEPTPRDMVAVRRADLLIYNGAGLEPWIPAMLASWSGGRPPVVEATRGLPLIDGDAHVWLDPLYARDMVQRIAGALSAVDPAGRDYYHGLAADYGRALEELHRLFEESIARCQRRDIVTSHAAFGYLARRYGLNIVSILGPGAEAEPSPRRLEEVIRFVRRKGVTHIFYDPMAGSALAETVARETGARTLRLDPLEVLREEDMAAGKDYISVMKENLTNLVTALGCD